MKPEPFVPERCRYCGAHPFPASGIDNEGSAGGGRFWPRNSETLGVGQQIGIREPEVLAYAEPRRREGDIGRTHEPWRCAHDPPEHLGREIRHARHLPSDGETPEHRTTEWVVGVPERGRQERRDSPA